MTKHRHSSRHVRNHNLHFGLGLVCSIAIAALAAVADDKTTGPSYSEPIPPGYTVPVNAEGGPAVPRISSDFVGLPHTSKWCTSLFWQKAGPGSGSGSLISGDNGYGVPMHPHPLELRANKSGLLMGTPAMQNYVPIDAVTTCWGQFPGFAEPAIYAAMLQIQDTSQLHIGVDGLGAGDCEDSSSSIQVKAVSDWTVTASWNESNSTCPNLVATFGRGLPFVFAEAMNGNAVISPLGDPWTNYPFEGISLSDDKKAVYWTTTMQTTSEVMHYAAFLPAGGTAEWTHTRGSEDIESSEPTKFAVAAMPNGDAATKAMFLAASEARVKGTTFEWTVNKGSSSAPPSVTGTYSFILEDGAAGAGGILTALLPHHYANTITDATEVLDTNGSTPARYLSTRGYMHLYQLNGKSESFTVETPFNGLIPHFQVPQVDGLQEKLKTDLEEWKTGTKPGDLPQYNYPDTYTGGKQMGTIGQMIPLTEQVNGKADGAALVAELKPILEAWLTKHDDNPTLIAPCNEQPFSGGLYATTATCLTTSDNARTSAVCCDQRSTCTTTLDHTLGNEVVSGIQGGTCLKFSNVDFGNDRFIGGLSGNAMSISYKFDEIVTPAQSICVEVWIDGPPLPPSTPGCGDCPGPETPACGKRAYKGGLETQTEGAPSWQVECISLSGDSGLPLHLNGVHDVYIAFGRGQAENPAGTSLSINKIGFPAYDDRFIGYDKTWGTMIGYKDGYGSAENLNDHQFHYGYWVMAAAAIAISEGPGSAWIEKWGLGIEWLIRDVANWETTSDLGMLFPKLRYFDPYSGHTWANGSASRPDGTNTESTSEAINFATGTILYGAATGNDDIRDLGIMLYSLESQAIQQYWFDVDEKNFPWNLDDIPTEAQIHGKTGPKLMGNIWDGKVDFATFFAVQPQWTVGIEILPITTGSLHLGAKPNMMVNTWDNLVHLLGHVPHNQAFAWGGDPPSCTTTPTSSGWLGILWTMYALGDPSNAFTEFSSMSDTFDPMDQNPRAQTRLFLNALNSWGTVDTSVYETNGHLHYAAFTNDTDTTILAWNPTDANMDVAFSNGTTGCLCPGEVAIINSQTCDCSAPCLGDVDFDGDTDGADLSELLARWGDCSFCPHDLSGDGDVDGEDLGLMLAYWGNCN